MKSPFDWVLGKFSADVGIDLGTANTLVAVARRRDSNRSVTTLSPSSTRGCGVSASDRTFAFADTTPSKASVS